MRVFALLLVALTLPAFAQDPASVGVRVHGVLPMGELNDLTNRQIGVGAAAFVAIPLGGGLVLRPLVGFQFIPRGDTLALAGTKTSVASIDFMVDGLWYPNEDLERGGYLVGGIGGQQWHVSSTGDSPSSINATRLGLNGGLGYQISPRFSVEVRGFWSPIQNNLTATGLTLGATMRF